MYIYSILLFLFALLLEGSVTTLPLTLMVVITMYCRYKDDACFLYAFVSGLCLDTFLLRPLGESSVIFLFVLLLIYLYQKKFEISSYYFLALALIVGFTGYTTFFGNVFYVGGMILTVGLGVSLYFLLQKTIPTDKRYNL